MSTYNIDPAHSTVDFTVKHMMIAKVHGGFQKIIGTFNYNPKNLSESKVEALIDINTIDTKDAERDGHLKSADFFDVEKYPGITFKSTEFRQDDSGNLLVSGDLTIKSIMKNIVLNVEQPSPEIKDPWGNIKIAISVSTKLNRKEFGLTWNTALEAGGFLVGDEISITLDVEFLKVIEPSSTGV